MKTQDIESYISAHEGDSGGSWEYQHTPFLTDVLSALTEEESNEFSAKLRNWKEWHLYQIADPIIFSSNKFLNKDLLYILIFSKIQNLEFLDYLAQNVIYSIRPPHYSEDSISSWKTKDLLNLKINVSRVLEGNIAGWESLKEVIVFLENELRERRIQH